MSGESMSGSPRILAVRLGALGDILHALPAVATLKHSFPGAHLTWIVEPRWAALLESNPFVDRVVLLRRKSAAGLLASWRELRATRYDFAVDFQGLLKSAVAASVAHPGDIFGFHRTLLRERLAAVFYTHQCLSQSAHVVDRNLDLAAAAGARDAVRVFPLPPGMPEGELPAGDFVLASPLAGWRSKQWPEEFYAELARSLQSEHGIPLVVNVPQTGGFKAIDGAVVHHSGLPGLIDATRRAAAVVGVDSGPMHLAAALGKPGVAIFGPTDPARNGPYGGTLRVLRAPGAQTTYQRGVTIHESMHRVSPGDVRDVLRGVLRCPVR